MLPEGTKETILSNTLKVFLKDGINGISMRKIASMSGISATAIYRHFQDKTELMQELIRSGFDQFFRILKKAEKEKDPVLRFLLLIQCYKEFAIKNINYYELIFMKKDELGFKVLPSEFKGKAEVSFHYLVQVSTEYVKAKKRDEDPYTFSIYVWAHLHGFVCLYIVGRLNLKQLSDCFRKIEKEYA